MYMHVQIVMQSTINYHFSLWVYTFFCFTSVAGRPTLPRNPPQVCIDLQSTRWQCCVMYMHIVYSQTESKILKVT